MNAPTDAAAAFHAEPLGDLSVREADGPAAGLRLSGQLREADISALAAALEPLVRAGAGTVVLDLAGLDSIEAGGFGAIVRAARRLQLAGRELVIRSPQSATYEILESIGLTEVLRVVA